MCDLRRPTRGLHMGLRLSWSERLGWLQVFCALGWGSLNVEFLPNVQGELQSARAKRRITLCEEPGGSTGPGEGGSSDLWNQFVQAEKRRQMQRSQD